MLQNSTYAEVGSHDYRAHFLCFWMASGPNFMTRVALESGLQGKYFSSSPWGSKMETQNTDMRGAGKQNLF